MPALAAAAGLNNSHPAADAALASIHPSASTLVTALPRGTSVATAGSRTAGPSSEPAGASRGAELHRLASLVNEGQPNLAASPNAGSHRTHRVGPALQTGTSVSNVVATNSGPTTAAGGQTTFLVTFITSSTGGMSQAANSQIFINYPADTNACTAGGPINDLTTGTQVGGAFHANFSPCTQTLGTLNSGVVIAAGDVLSTSLSAVILPTAAGSYSLSVSTTSDTTSASSNTYPVTAAQGVSNVVATNTGPTTAAGGQTTFSVEFTISSTGALSQAAGSQIFIDYPADTNACTTGGPIIDLTSGTQVGGAFHANFSSCQQTLGTLNSGVVIAAGDVLSISLSPLILPTTAGSYSLSVSTTSDTTSASSNTYIVTPAQGVSNVVVTNTGPTTITGGQTSFSVAFTASSTGGMTQAADSQISFDFPADTNVCTAGGALTDVSSGLTVAEVHHINFAPCTQLVGTLDVAAVINNNDELSAAISNIFLPSTSGSYTLVVSTTSDVNGSNSNAFVVSPPAPPVCQVHTIPGSDEPALVAVMVSGVQTSTPTDDFYPTDFGFTTAPDHPAVDSYCFPFAASHGPFPPSLTAVLGGYLGCAGPSASSSCIVNPLPSQGVETLPDQLAIQGAVLLPYSYQGAYFSSWPVESAQPLFHVNYSAKSDPGNTSPAQQASFLWGEVASIHSYWPDAAIEIIADSGGGVPAEYYWNTGFQRVADHNGVTHIFTLDAPINGIDHTFLASLVLNNLGQPVRDFYGSLWQNMDTNDQQELTADSDGSFRPIGTEGDYSYALGDLQFDFTGGIDADLNALLSQLLVQCTGLFNDTCAPQLPPDFLSPCPGSNYAGDASHEVVRICKPTVDYITGITASDEQSAVGHSSTRSLSTRKHPSNRMVPSPWPTVSTAAGSTQVRQILGPGPHTQVTMIPATSGQTITITGSSLGSSPGAILFAGSNGVATLPGTISAWTDTAVSIVVPSGVVSGPIVLETSGGVFDIASSLAALTGPSSVASLRVVPPVPVAGGLPLQIAVTALGSSGKPLAGAPVSLFDGSLDHVAVTNSKGVATFSVADFGTQEYLAHSGDATDLVTVSWIPLSGALFSPIQQLTPACTSIVSGNHAGSLKISTPTCFQNATIAGHVTVTAGGSLTITNSTIAGGIAASNASSIIICSSRISGSVNANRTTGPVLIGDGGDDSRVGGCGPDVISGAISLMGGLGPVELASVNISGAVSISNNTVSGADLENARVEVEGNMISGSLSCSANNPVPTNDGQPNAVSGSEAGQCAGF